MLIRVLGSTAGGGVPQWNCGCRQCNAARSGILDSRTQCSIGISTDERRWVLVNASPDVRYQLTYLKCRPSPQTRPLDFEPLLCRNGAETGLEYKAVEIAGPGPRYRRSGRHSCRVFYVVRELATGRSVLLAPAVAQLEPQLLVELNRADAILFDGTLWSNDDFERSGVCTRSMAELLQSHLPISSGSLETLAAMPANHKIYVHINNTNPILWDSGPERQLLRESRIRVATDGMTIEV